MELITSKIPLPSTLPVMVLSDCTLFPHCLLPLCIFEPRYRQMLTHALETDRMFCIGTIQRDADDRDDDAIRSVSTAALIRACVSQPDGTSNLILQGVRRIRLGEWQQREPFRLAAIEEFDENPAGLNAPQADETPASLDQIANELVSLTSANGSLSETLTHHLRTLDNASATADVIAHNVVGDPDLKQQILEIPRLRTRLRLLLAYCNARAGEA